MSFTPEHKEILEKHKHYWESLKTLGFMRNLDKPVFNELQKVHNEAISVNHYPSWCGECVADMVRTLYLNYEKDPVDTITHPPAKRRRNE